MIKKKFTFRYAPQSASLSKRLVRAIKTKKSDVHPNEMECSSLKTLLEITTESRLKMLETIIQENPSSLYELSKQLEKA
jgi:predicted transcriptional regulator